MFLINSRVILFSLFSIPLVVVAQTRCPVGVQAGNIQCLPDDESSAPSRPTGEWIETWGAVSGSASGDMWTTVGKLSKQDAEDDVMRQCRKFGASDCEIRGSYKNQCVAVAATSEEGGNALATGSNKKTAGKRAVDKCEVGLKKKCEVVYSDCSDAIYKKY